jgi:signal transduction histidine kinase
VVSVRLPARDQQLLAWNRVLILIAGTLAGLLAVMVFYLVVTRLVLSPVRDLKAVAEEASAGDLAVRSSIHTGDEFEDLAETFNRMLSNLQKSQGELESVNRSLDTRLAELAQRNVDLYESNRLQAEFLANVSHELRTPLSSIIGFAELLHDAAPPPEAEGDDAASASAPQGDGATRIPRYAANILSSGRILLELINDLLDLARIEAGKMRMHPTNFRMADVCEAVLDFTRPLIDKKDISVSLDVADDLPPMHSDSGKVQQILYNLMSNAVKFTPERGRITMTAGREGKARVRLAVRDTGPGIPADMQSTIFEKFRQLDASVTRAQGGTGLGLAISKELAHLLGGTLTVESAPEEGSTFILTIPAECPEEVERPLIRLNR